MKKVVVIVVGRLLGPELLVVFQAREFGVLLNDPGTIAPPGMTMFVPKR